LERANSHRRDRRHRRRQGIAPEVLPFIFNVSVKPTRRRCGRTADPGLVLLVRAIWWRWHGGTVEVESIGENHGSTFTVKFPPRCGGAYSAHAAKVKPEKGVSDNEQRFTVQLPAWSLDGLRPLVVDDEDTRALLKMVLERCGASVMTALPHSSREAIVALKQSRPTLTAISECPKKMDTA